MSSRNLQPDIFIVGGGPAALASAIAASDKGFRVTVADAARPPLDKACGEGLMPDAVLALETLGVTLDPGEAIPFRGIRFHDAANKTVADGRFPGRPGLAMRRTALHEKLLRHATRRGVTFAWGARVTGIGNCEVAVNGQRVRSRWIIGADGQDSHMRRWMGLEPLRREPMRFGSRQHFQLTPWSDFVEVYWCSRGQLTVAPVGADEVCVAVTSRNPHCRVREALCEAPELAERLASARAVTRERGSPCQTRRLWAVHRGHMALVGDASGSVDPITGAGVGLGLKQAELLASALRDNNLRRYGVMHRRVSRIPRLMSRIVLLMDAHPRWRRAILHTLASDPTLFSRLLSLHVRAPTRPDFEVADALRLGWRFVTVGRSGRKLESGVGI